MKKTGKKWRERNPEENKDREELNAHHRTAFENLIFSPNSTLAFFTLSLHQLDWKNSLDTFFQTVWKPNVPLSLTSIMCKRFQKPVLPSSY